MIDDLDFSKFLLLSQTGNVSYALSLSQELLHHSKSLKTPFLSELCHTSLRLFTHFLSQIQ